MRRRTLSKKSLLSLVLVLVTVIGLGVLLLVSRQAKVPVIVSRTDPPRISFETKTHDLGSLNEGVQVPYVFKIHNLGGEPLEITDATSSCGCTLINLKDRIIAPGKTGDLEVVMDTAMKQGPVRKEIIVRSNDPKRAEIKVYLLANVLPNPERLSKLGRPNLPQPPPLQVQTTQPAPETNPHANLTAMGRAKIFTGNCATCHVQQGQGKLGKELFQADCAMCHGAQAQGAVGPALVPGNYNDPAFVAHIRQIIEHGSPNHPSMPGFLKAAGGPLSEGEIDTLLDYLKTQSQEGRAEPVKAAQP